MLRHITCIWLALRTGLGIALSSRDYREFVLDAATLTALVTLCKEHNIAQWNGFHKNAPDVRDGTAFSFTMTLPDGRGISASGENSFPSGYGVIKKAIQDFLSTIRAQKMTTAHACNGVVQVLHYFQGE